MDLTDEEINVLMKCVSMACSEGLYLLEDGEYEELATTVEKLGCSLKDIYDACM